MWYIAGRDISHIQRLAKWHFLCHSEFMIHSTISTPQGEFRLIQASELRDSLAALPPEPGVYLWFVKHGDKLLEASSYFETDDRMPVTIGDHVHLYTGSAYDLRFRVGQHLRNECRENSSPRKSLLALEHMFSAITQVYGSQYDDLDAGGLTRWMYDNVIFAYEVHQSPVARETALIYRMATPFNIAHRRQHRYSKYLMAWRAIAFPSEWMKTVPLRSPSDFDFARVASRRELMAAVNVK